MTEFQVVKVAYPDSEPARVITLRRTIHYQRCAYWHGERQVWYELDREVREDNTRYMVGYDSTTQVAVVNRVIPSEVYRGYHDEISGD